MFRKLRRGGRYKLWFAYNERNDCGSCGGPPFAVVVAPDAETARKLALATAESARRAMARVLRKRRGPGWEKEDPRLAVTYAKRVEPSEIYVCELTEREILTDDDQRT